MMDLFAMIGDANHLSPQGSSSSQGMFMYKIITTYLLFKHINSHANIQYSHAHQVNRSEY